MDSLYTDLLLDLARHPRNKNTLVEFDVRQHLKNPLCSDEIDVFIKFDKKNKVADVGWVGEGCAVSTAGSSLVTDYVKGKNKTEIKNISAEKVLELMGLPNISPARVGCATLCLKAMQNGITK